MKLSYIRMILHFIANLDLKLEQLDGKTIFLYGNLEKEVYMFQPKEFEIKGKENLI